MAISVRDEMTDAAVRRLAKFKNKGLTETIREAVENEYDRSRRQTSLVERLQVLGNRWADVPRTGDKADKAFFDSIGDDL